MSRNPPQTLSVKRKRNEAPVDALLFEHTLEHKRSRLDLKEPSKAPRRPDFYFKLLEKPIGKIHAATAPPTPTAERRFHLDSSGNTSRQHVFIEKRTVDQQQGGDAIQNQGPPTILEPPSRSPPRKRPGAGSALRSTSKPPTADTPVATNQPSENDVRALEALSDKIAKEDNLIIPLPPSPSKHRPKAPAKRFAERHPDKAAELAAQEAANGGGGDAMDIDTDEYVYDTYIRAPLPPSSTTDPSAPNSTLGPNVGYLVISSEDGDWWNNSDSSDNEFDTDDEDENAEDYYANDYPEDEMSEDDEFDRNLYQKRYRHGSDDEEFDLADGSGEEDERALGSDEDEDDLHFRMTVPKAQRGGYWGTVGE